MESPGSTNSDLIRADLVGVGAGPANLSLAALASSLSGLNAVFFERQPEFRWHPGLLLPQATLQVSFLKDLVTLVDPTSPLSFLAFLHDHQRLYRFLNARFPAVSRHEFEEYLRWVCHKVETVRLGHSVDRIEIREDEFQIEAGGSATRSKNVVIATGLRPLLPKCCEPFEGPQLLHAGEWLSRRPKTAGKRVAIVGGGQSAAELVDHLLSTDADLPDQLHWITRRDNFRPLDDSPFVNELFGPAHSVHFNELESAKRIEALALHKLASDGINNELLQSIYQRIYALELVKKRKDLVHLHIERELIEIYRGDEGLMHLQLAGAAGTSSLNLDLVVAATGYHCYLPDFLSDLRSRMNLSGDMPEVSSDFRIALDGPQGLNLFLNNLARPSHGIAEHNLGLIPWRNAKILNRILGTDHYRLDEQDTFMQWGRETAVETRI